MELADGADRIGVVEGNAPDGARRGSKGSSEPKTNYFVQIANEHLVTGDESDNR